MEWQSIAGQLAQIGLPALGGLFGGPLGSTIGGLVGKGVAAALGVEATPAAVATAIQADPSGAAVKLAQIEAETKNREAELADVMNARATTVQLVQEGSAISWGVVVMTGIAIAGFLVVSVIAMRAPPGADQGVVLYLLGVWSAAFTAALNFWTGSSSGSRAKDAQIGAALQTASAPVGRAVASAVTKSAGR